MIKLISSFFFFHIDKTAFELLFFRESRRYLEEYQRTQREAFEKAVVINVEASSAVMKPKPGSTASQRIDNLLGGTGVMYAPRAVREFESALEPAVAAAAAFKESAAQAEALADSRRQMFDNVNFANEYERKRQQLHAAIPDAERALTKNYLDRLDPAKGSWMHQHALDTRAHWSAMNIHGEQHAQAHWATKCWTEVVMSVKALGVADNGGKFLILVIVVFTVSWYGLVSP